MNSTSHDAGTNISTAHSHMPAMGRGIYNITSSDARHALDNETPLRMVLGTEALHIKHILNDTECLESTFLKYLASTNRLKATFGDVAPPKETEPKHTPHVIYSPILT
ncbi:hypothetical protein BDR04DRAFT_1106095 [Suillus decipiens]|nr:hypothetical protein BDR04DRAFT_1106095 [Suillus decipiens]